MAKRKRNTPFGGRKKFNRAVMNSDMDGKGDKASHVQGSSANAGEDQIELSWKQGNSEHDKPLQNKAKQN